MRPRVAIPARFAERTSATAGESIVLSIGLAEAVWLAGGDPVIVYPTEDSNWSERLADFDGLLLPGGGDVSPTAYGQELASDEVYGVNALQDATDLSLAKWAIETGMPLLAICRGCQLVNVAFGGTLIQHMDDDHRNLMHEITVENPAQLGLSSAQLFSSCYHHQAIDQLGEGLEVIARSGEGVIEAIRIPSSGWAYGVQWHPEHTATENPHQLDLMKKFVSECSRS